MNRSINKLDFKRKGHSIMTSVNTNYLERIKRLKERVLSSKPEIDLENALILTEGFKEAEGEPLVIRKAHAFAKQCREKSIFINDDELIVGSIGRKLRGSIFSPDTCWSVLDKEMETISTRKFDPFIFREEDKKAFKEKILPYWRGRSILEQWEKQIPEDTRRLRDNGVIYIDRRVVRGPGEATAGYEWLINTGIRGILEVIKERKARLDLTVPGDYKKDYYLRSLLIVGEGIITLANRYADLAEQMAINERDVRRAKELRTIAKVCRRVPEYPATNFHEALQSLYFYHSYILMEQNAPSYNPGRMDQYLYPYFKTDIESGNMNKDQAQELLDCLWIKFNEASLFQDAETAKYSAGYSLFQNVCVGGINEYGEDAVNDLSYHIIQATMDVQLPQPSLSVRYNMAKNPDSFLRKVVDLIKLGTGFPAFHNDEVGIKMMLNKGIPLKEAYDWNPCGCVETNLAGRLRQFTDAIEINLGSMVELAINNGICRKSGELVGEQVGNCESFINYEDFEEAVKKQIAFMVRVAVKGNHVIDEIGLDRPCPVLSLTFKECIENASDYDWGGAKYTRGNGVILVGIADLINSLVAVRKLVYEDKTVSMKELTNALAANFKGYEDILRKCLDAPKYGNDDFEADELVGRIFSFIADEIEKYDSRYGHMSPGILPVTSNTPFGMEVGALPSGRLSGKPLADGISPTGGTDMNGISAVLKSVAHLPHGRFVQGTLLNQKIEPEFLNTEHGILAMMNLLKSMCSLGVYHIQFNVIDEETLRRAQKNPENYRGLLVRVAGYTAYFTELTREIQDDIISRTTQGRI